jgi:AraC-like DNA-binding protein
MTTPAYGRLDHRSFVDSDEYQASVRGGDSLYSLLGRGEFRADLTDIEIGQVRLQRGCESLPRLAAWGTPANQIGIVVWPPRKSQLPIVRGAQIQPGDMLCFGQGMQSHHRTFGANEFMTLMLNSADLTQAAHAWTGRELVVASGQVLRPPKNLLVKLISVAQSAMRIGDTMPEVFASAQAAKGLEQALLQSMIMCLQQGELRKEGALRTGRAALAKKLEEAIDANLDQPLHLLELCRMSGLPERSLRKLFLEQMGISPSRFLALRRLHLARRALLRTDPYSTTVTEIATNVGIWEFGRFSVAYKSWFGESPSATLRRRLGS